MKILKHQEKNAVEVLVIVIIIGINHLQSWYSWDHVAINKREFFINGKFNQNRVAYLLIS